MLTVAGKAEYPCKHGGAEGVNQIALICLVSVGQARLNLNHIENTKSDGFHIHCATSRYQAIARAEDGYAVPTTRYCDINGAVQCLLNDANFEEPT